MDGGLFSFFGEVEIREATLPETNIAHEKKSPSFLVKTIKMVDFPASHVRLGGSVRNCFFGMFFSMFFVVCGDQVSGFLRLFEVSLTCFFSY